MQKTYTVIVVATGDGESNYGRRIWSERFNTMAAADMAATFIKKAGGSDTNVKIVEDSAA